MAVFCIIIVSQKFVLLLFIANTKPDRQLKWSERYKSDIVSAKDVLIKCLCNERQPTLPSTILKNIAVITNSLKCSKARAASWSCLKRLFLILFPFRPMKTTQGSSDENVNAALCFIRDVDMHFLDMYFSDKVLNTKKTRKHKDVVFYMIKFHHVSCTCIHGISILKSADLKLMFF